MASEGRRDFVLAQNDPNQAQESQRTSSPPNSLGDSLKWAALKVDHYATKNLHTDN
jgi:hypothetical protein